MKKILLTILTIILIITAVLCVMKPTMHKQLSFSVINYIIKFNDDGSMTTLKQTTTTKLKKEGIE